jgi:hypothetical protein
MAVGEWVVEAVWFLSELVTGSAVLKAVDITTSQRMLAVFDVAQAVREQRLWLILGILPRWTLPPATVWVLAPWLELLVLVLLLPRLVDSVLAVVMAVNISEAPQALMHSHPDLVPQLVDILRCIPTSVVHPLELTLLVHSTAEQLRPLSNLLATVLLQPGHQTTSTLTKVKATPLPSSQPVSATCP